MIPAYSGFLALRYLLTRWVNVLGMLGVAVAVWALIVVVAVFSGFIGEIRSSIRNATPDLLCTGLPAGTSFRTIDQALRADDDVAATAPRLRHYGMYFPYGRFGRRIQQTHGLTTTPLAFDFVELVGIDPAREFETSNLARWLQSGAEDGLGVADPAAPLDVPVAWEERWRRRTRQAGTPGPLLNASPGILLSTRRIDLGRLETGQLLSVVSARFVKNGDDTDLRRVRRYFSIAGGYETRHRVLDETTALIPIDELRSMLGYQPDDPFAIDVVSDVAIRVREGADLKTVATRLQAGLADSFGATVLTWEEQNGVFLGAVDQERGMMKLTLFAVMLVAAFLIYATLHMTVTQKIRDIGILTSLGAAPGGVMRIFLLSGAVVGVTGCLLGAVGGVLSAVYLNDVNDWTRETFGVELFPIELYALESVPYQLEPEWIVQVVVLAFTIAILAAWLPARRAARLDPVRALAHE